MRLKDSRKRSFAAQIEHLEPRQVMSAAPLGFGDYGFDEGLENTSAVATPEAGQYDFWLNDQDRQLQHEYASAIDQFLAEAHAQTGWYNVQSQYGFTGRGQTVVVIDSGIAYDHFALGGGFGANYRVVGGWDFAENDANPYDDSGSGSSKGHGTHVAGIVGNSSGTHSGVAPGVDLVSLRVFNDSGYGSYRWVESSLKWVLNNLNNYENPITTINLSLGDAGWNSMTVPQWTMLEDEFAQLKAAGIFISVAAGNSYANFNSPGLSYPASSPYVVPVMSTDDSGSLSYYSQRLDRAIAAPGRNIVSTVPDYKGNNNGIADDYATMSGTSMAAPYVAGASVLIREAMQLVGMTNITQDTIYNHMMATADVIVDAASGLSYKRLDLQAAIDALMPADDYGSTQQSAHALELGSGTAAISGAIGTVGDQDYFSFTAAASGQVTFEMTATGPGMAPAWQAYSGSGQALASASGAAITFDVVAGQRYSVGLSSSGTGTYSFNVTAASSFSFEDWGAVAYRAIDDVAVAGEAWYRVQASQAGYLTVQGAYDAAAGNVAVDLYDANMVRVAAGTAAGGVVRVDAAASAGATFYVRVTGASSDVDFKLVNLVSQSGGIVTALGTAGDDAICFVSGSTLTLAVNGVSYEFAAGGVSQVNIDAGAGNDSVVITGSANAEIAALRYGSVNFASASLVVDATGVEDIVVNGDVADQAVLYDSAGDDTYFTYSDHVVMSSQAGRLLAAGFSRTVGVATTGDDVVRNYDSSGDDVYRTYVRHTVMERAGYSNEARGFARSFGYASQGIDRVYNYDSSGNDSYYMWANATTMAGNGYSNSSQGFESAYGYALGGSDKAFSYDYDGADEYRAWSDHVMRTGAGSYNFASGFDRAYAYSSGGDVAYLYGTDGDDLLKAWTDRAIMSGNGYENVVEGFTKTYSYAGGGANRALLYDSSGDDLYRAWMYRAVLSGAGFYNSVQDFQYIFAYGSGGADEAHLYDTAGNDVYFAWYNQAVMKGVDSAYYNYVYNFAETHGYATKGKDDAYLRDSPGDDVFESWSDRAVLSGVGFRRTVSGFDEVFAIGSTGRDRAVFHDSLYDDVFTLHAWGARMVTPTVTNKVFGFDEIEARGLNGGKNRVNWRSVDFVFSQIGAWE